MEKGLFLDYSEKTLDIPNPYVATCATATGCSIPCCRKGWRHVFNWRFKLYFRLRFNLIIHKINIKKAIRYLIKF